jgi:hypothetical protein
MCVTNQYSFLLLLAMDVSIISSINLEKNRLPLNVFNPRVPYIPNVQFFHDSYIENKTNPNELVLASDEDMERAVQSKIKNSRCCVVVTVTPVGPLKKVDGYSIYAS